LLIGGCRIGFQTGDPATSDGDGGSDGSTIADGFDSDAASSPCGTTMAIADDFEDGVTAAAWTTLTGNNLTLAETGGLLQITFASNVPAGQTAGYLSTASYNFTGSCVDAEITSIPNPATLATMVMRVGSPTDCGEIEIYSGMINASQHRGASITRLPAFAFDAVADRFLRMREVAGSWYYQSSPDGIAWTTFGTVADKFALQVNTTVRFTSGTNSALNNGGTAAFASVHITTP
jgi:hypothetical protein